MHTRGPIVSDVLPGSPAARAGIRAGDMLLSINGECVTDVVDYEYLCAVGRLRVRLQDERGAKREVSIRKHDGETLGLTFASSLLGSMRMCKNRCVFCFIDQMPKGVRTSLHVKDDDWRMSFIMGNYVTLTNIGEAEFERIIRRRVSPLFVSLHASDPAVRVRMMGNPSAGRVIEQLTRLKEAGLRFHLQVVLCPGLNDGDVMRRTIADAAALMPAAQSLAVVPVGLTRFRADLFPLRRYEPAEARSLIAELEALQAGFLASSGTRFVFLADEWYTRAGLELPPFEAYEEFSQIENGVGLLRLFENEFVGALDGREPLTKPRMFAMAGGESAEPFFCKLYQKLVPYGVTIETHAIVNRYFGESVTVAGLVTGGDLVEEMRGATFGEGILIPRAMLKADEDVFLDGMTLEAAERALGARLLPVGTGEELIETVFGGPSAIV